MTKTTVALATLLAVIALAAIALPAVAQESAPVYPEGTCVNHDAVPHDGMDEWMTSMHESMPAEPSWAHTEHMTATMHGEHGDHGHPMTSHPGSMMDGASMTGWGPMMGAEFMMGREPNL